MPYIHFTDEQKERANSVDLVDFLRAQGEEISRSGHDFRWARHDSVTLRGNRWYQHSASKGGLAIDFVRKFYNMEFPDAVTKLLNGEHGAGFVEADMKPPPPSKPFKLPEAHTDMRRVFAYLTKSRCIDREVIRHFASAGTLFEDAKYHNAVFVGKDENGVPCHAHKRSTYTLGDSFRGNVEGSDAKCSFHHKGESQRLYVYEAPVDMMSFLTIHGENNWQRHNHVALCGVSPQAMMWMLEQNPQISAVALCLDNDVAGHAAAERLTETLRQAGYENVSCLFPDYKDWNEQLQSHCQDEPEQEMVMSM
jgi:hypothetical protein